MSLARRCRVLTAVWLVAVGLGACKSEPLETDAACATDADCQSGRKCEDGTCVNAPATSFGKSDCGQCVQQICDTEFGDCDVDASCGAYLGCLLDCPVADGDVDAACEAACPEPADAAAAAARDAFDACRASSAAAACAACGSSTPGGGGAGPTGVGGAPPTGELCSGSPALNQSCDGGVEPATCEDCIFERCCESIDATSQSGPETDLFNCWLACTTTECEDQCYQTYPDPAGIELFGAYGSCMTVNCFGSDLCPLKMAGVAGGVSPCTKCLGAKCACELTDCDTDAECHLAHQCIGTCDNDTACSEACAAAHPAGQAKLELLMVCIAQNCIEDC